MTAEVFTLTSPVYVEPPPVGAFGYLLLWQDYRDWSTATSDERPVVRDRRFDTVAEARSAMAEVLDVEDGDMIAACVVAAPPPRVRVPRHRRIRPRLTA